MDPYSAIGSTSGIISLVGIVGYAVYKLFVHSHCKSACCGRNVVDVYVNLDDTEPQPIVLPVSSSTGLVSKADLTSPNLSATSRSAPAS